MKKTFIDRVDHGVEKLGDWLSVIFLIVVVIGFFEVVMRYVFDAPTLWVHETTTFLISISLLYGGVSCYAVDRHIAMTFIRERFSAKTQWIMQLIVECMMFMFISMLTYGAYCTARDAFISPFGKIKLQTSGTILDTPFPAINKGFLLLSCSAILVLCCLHIYRHIMRGPNWTQVEQSEAESELEQHELGAKHA